MKMSCSNVAAVFTAAAATAIQPELDQPVYIITIPPWNVMQGDVANGLSVRSSICPSIIVLFPGQNSIKS